MDPAVAATTTPSEPSGTTLLTEGAKEAAAPVEGEKKPAASPGAPETYADYTLPEGYSLDAETKTKANTLFKGLGLSQEAAQSLVDFYVAETKAAQEAPFKAWSDMQAEWKSAAESHPDLQGKLGPGKEINVRIGRLLGGLDPQLASDFRSLMDLTGAGNHPAFIRALDHWAQQLSEGTHVAGNGPSQHGQSVNGAARRTAAQVLYPNNPSSAN